jgi:HAD superfamily hydrolase (TIGR01509 family)
MFECVVGKEHVHYCKPNTEGFNVLQEKVAIKYEETVFIGDSAADSGAAKALGIDYLDVTEL